MIDPADIRRLNLGYYTAPATSRWPGEKVAVCAYVVRYPGGVLLFDTGIGTGHAETEREFSPIYRRSLQAELADCGLSVDDITAVANCHLHIDHCGGNPLLGHAPIFVQQRELDALPELDYVLPEVVYFPGVSLAIHDGAADIAPGVRIIPTPGHTPGHQSVLVQTTRGVVLLAGQALSFASDYARVQFGFDVEAAGTGQVIPAPPHWLTELRELEVRRVLFAHDQLAWEAGPATGRLA